MLHTSDGITWRHTTTAVDYPDAVASMEEQVAGILSGTADECVWLAEHPSPVHGRDQHRSGRGPAEGEPAGLSHGTRRGVSPITVRANGSPT